MLCTNVSGAREINFNIYPFVWYSNTKPALRLKPIIHLRKLLEQDKVRISAVLLDLNKCCPHVILLVTVASW